MKKLVSKEKGTHQRIERIESMTDGTVEHKQEMLLGVLVVVPPVLHVACCMLHVLIAGLDSLYNMSSVIYTHAWFGSNDIEYADKTTPIRSRRPSNLKDGFRLSILFYYRYIHTFWKALSD